MKNDFKMKEACNKEQAVVSILDVMKENPVWLNKCNNALLMLLKVLSPKRQKFLLNKSIESQVIDLFVDIKTQYYVYQDHTRWI